MNSFTPAALLRIRYAQTSRGRKKPDIAAGIEEFIPSRLLMRSAYQLRIVVQEELVRVGAQGDAFHFADTLVVDVSVNE